MPAAPDKAPLPKLHSLRDPRLSHASKGLGWHCDVSIRVRWLRWANATVRSRIWDVRSLTTAQRPSETVPLWDVNFLRGPGWR